MEDKYTIIARSGYLTGSAGSSVNANSESTVNAYDTVNGTKASTTGTIYGVYDMAGGSWEYVSGVLTGYESKFGTSVDNKYLDIYENSTDSRSNYDGAITGDATKETLGWNGDSSSFVYSGFPVFARDR